MSDHDTPWTKLSHGSLYYWMYKPSPSSDYHKGICLMVLCFYPSDSIPNTLHLNCFSLTILTSSMIFTHMVYSCLPALVFVVPSTWRDLPQRYAEPVPSSIQVFTQILSSLWDFLWTSCLHSIYTPLLSHTFYLLFQQYFSPYHHLKYYIFYIFVLFIVCLIHSLKCELNEDTDFVLFAT